MSLYCIIPIYLGFVHETMFLSDFWLDEIFFEGAWLRNLMPGHAKFGLKSCVMSAVQMTQWFGVRRNICLGGGALRPPPVKNYVREIYSVHTVNDTLEE